MQKECVGAGQRTCQASRQRARTKMTTSSVRESLSLFVSALDAPAFGLLIAQLKYAVDLILTASYVLLTCVSAKRPHASHAAPESYASILLLSIRLALLPGRTKAGPPKCRHR